MFILTLKLASFSPQMLIRRPVYRLSNHVMSMAEEKPIYHCHIYSYSSIDSLNKYEIMGVPDVSSLVPLPALYHMKVPGMSYQYNQSQAVLIELCERVAHKAPRVFNGSCSFGELRQHAARRKLFRV